MDGVKQTRGRQKIEMKLIENEEDRLITFSKRRSGIYKKASELATLCGADVGVVVFSPSGKPFSFANPSMEYITNRFFNRNPLQDTNETHHLMETHRRDRVEELNKKYNQLQTQLEAEKAKGKELRRLSKAKDKDEKGWWEAPVDELDIYGLKQLNKSLAELHLDLTTHISQRKSTTFGASSSIANHHHHHRGGALVGSDGGTNDDQGCLNPGPFPNDATGTDNLSANFWDYNN